MLLVDLECGPGDLELSYRYIHWSVCVHGACHLLKSDCSFGIWRAKTSPVLPKTVFVYGDHQVDDDEGGETEVKGEDADS
jgi:hypothetical protein